jgi:large subunit ribosomal protein L20
MVRVKRGFVARRRRNKVFKKVKGFRRTLRTQFRRAKQATYHAGVHATRDRKAKKRIMRRLWIVRLNAAVKNLGLKYSQFISLLKKKNILLDRKTLADLAVNHAQDFAKLVNSLKG